MTSSIDINNPPKKYKVIYADPPWSFNSKKTGGSMKSGAEYIYPTMTIEDLKALPVPGLCEDSAILVMWYVSSQPQEAIDLAESWGFKVKHMNGFIWDKLTVKGLPFFGMGFYTRAGAESALIAIKGKCGDLIANHSVRQVRKAKIGRHSEKPSEFRRDIEIMCGECNRLEMFARKTTNGWDVFGNEV